MTPDPNIFLAALADSTRLRIVALLQRHGELCVCDLVTALDSHQPKVSRHLAILRKSELILGRRTRQWIHYRIHPNLPDWAQRALVEILRGCETTPDMGADEQRLDAAIPGSGCTSA